MLASFLGGFQMWRKGDVRACARIPHEKRETQPGLENGGEVLSLRFMTFMEPPYARKFLVKYVQETLTRPQPEN